MKNFTLCLLICLPFAAFSQLIDPGFEGGVDNSGWQQSSTNFGTPLCDAACGTCGGPCVPQAGDWYLWLGGAGNNEEIGIVSQLATIPNGTTGTLSFYVYVATPATGSEDDVAYVRVDGNTLFTVTAADSVEYDEYTLVSVNVSAYTDGEEHWIEVYGDQNEGSNILFDTFSLVVDGVVQTGFEELMNQEATTSVYPNPAANEIQVQFNNIAGLAIVKMFDMNGKLVNAETLPEVHNSTFRFDTANFANGVYNLQVEHGTQVMHHRFMVSH